MKKSKTTAADSEPAIKETDNDSVVVSSKGKKNLYRAGMLIGLIVVTGVMVGAVQYAAHKNAEKKASQAAAALVVKSTGKGFDSVSRLSPADEAKQLQAGSYTEDEKSLSTVSAAFKSFYAGDYDTALSLSKPYAENPKYHKDIVCNMYVKIYEARQQNAELVRTANDCAALTLKNLPKDPLNKNIALYQVGSFYEKAGNFTEAKKYFAQFVKYVDDTKQQKVEAITNLYNHAKEAM